MTERQTEEVAIYNRRSLEKLTWLIEASQGRFSLILARCHYLSLRSLMVTTLSELSSTSIRHLSLKESDTDLYTAIQAELGNEQPAALMVFGLESIRSLPLLLKTANQLQEQFEETYHFPLILWVNDHVSKQLVEVAPEFEARATTTDFILASEQLIQFLHQAADSISANLLNTDISDFDSVYNQEIDAALKDLRNRRQEIDQALKIRLEFLRYQQSYLRNQLRTALTPYFQLSQQLLQTEAQNKSLEEERSQLETINSILRENQQKLNQLMTIIICCSVSGVALSLLFGGIMVSNAKREVESANQKVEAADTNAKNTIIELNKLKKQLEVNINPKNKQQEDLKPSATDSKTAPSNAEIKKNP